MLWHLMTTSVEALWWGSVASEIKASWKGHVWSRLCRGTHQEIAPGLRRVTDGGWLPDVPLQLLHVQGEFLTPCPGCGMCSVRMYHAASASWRQHRLLLHYLSVENLIISEGVHTYIAKVPILRAYLSVTGSVSR